MDKQTREELLVYLLEQGLTEEQMQKAYGRALKDKKDKVFMIRMSLGDWMLVKDNPSKKIRDAIKRVYGRLR